jgi:hypothetical protein
MRAHDAECIIPILPHQPEKSERKPAFTVGAMHDQLGDPANSLPINRPPAGEGVSSKLAIDGDSRIRRDAVRQIFSSQSFFVQPNPTT